MEGHRIAPDTWTEGDSGFAAMGKPVPYFRQQAGHEHCKAMGLDSEKAFACVKIMAEKIRRDKPLDALNECSEYFDVCGCYRLLAVLLTAAKVEV